MSVVDRFRYVAELSSAGGEPLGAVTLNPDWRPAFEWSLWDGVRHGTLRPLARCAHGIVEPQWDEDLGEPHVAGLQTVIETDDPAHPHRATIPRSYFTAAAERESTKLVASGKLSPGETFRYSISAYSRQDIPEERDAPAMRGTVVEEIVQPITLQPGSLNEFLERSSSHTPPGDDHDDMRVLVPHSVIEETTALVRQAGDIEIGGVLVGQLHRDAETDDLFCVVTAQIEGRHTNAAKTSLTFTPDTWAAARSALALRNRGEIFVGWWHGHPFWCSKCEPERRRTCPLSRPFFSRDDVALHRAVFGRGFDVALLITNLGEDDLACDLFGWRHGMVTRRGYHVTDGPAPAPAAGAGLAAGDAREPTLSANSHEIATTASGKSDDGATKPAITY